MLYCYGEDNCCNNYLTEVGQQIFQYKKNFFGDLVNSGHKNTFHGDSQFGKTSTVLADIIKSL